MAFNTKYALIYLGLCVLESCACLEKNLTISAFAFGSRARQRESKLATHLKHNSVVATIANATPTASMPATDRKYVFGSGVRYECLLQETGVVFRRSGTAL